MGRWTIAAPLILLLLPPIGPGSCTDGSEHPDGRGIASHGWSFGLSTEEDGPDLRGAGDSEAERLRLLASLATDEGPFRGRLFPNHCMRVQLELVDRLGGPAPRDQDTVIQSVTSRPELAVFSDELCERVTTQLRIPAGFSTASVYVRSRDGFVRDSRVDFEEAVPALPGRTVAESQAPEPLRATQSPEPLRATQSPETRSPEWSEPVLVSTRVREAEGVGFRPFLELTPSGALYLAWSEMPSSSVASKEARPSLGMPGSAAPSAQSVLRFARSVRLWESTSISVAEPDLWQSLQSPQVRDAELVLLRVSERDGGRALLGWRRHVQNESDPASSVSLELSTALLDDGDSRLSWMSPAVIDEVPHAPLRTLASAAADSELTASRDPADPASLILHWEVPSVGRLRVSRFDFDSAVVDEARSFVGDVAEREFSSQWIGSIASPLLHEALRVWRSEDARGVARIWAERNPDGAASDGRSRRLRQTGSRTPISLPAENVSSVSLAGNEYDRFGILYTAESVSSPSREVDAAAGTPVSSESVVFRPYSLVSSLGSKLPAGAPDARDVLESGTTGTLSEPVLGMDRKGQAFAVWIRHRVGKEVAQSTWELRFATRGDQGRSWDLPVTLASSTEALSRLKMSVDASGNAIVSWVEGVAETGEGLRVRRLVPGVGWQPVVALNGGAGKADASRSMIPVRIRGYDLQVGWDTGFAALGWIEESADAGTFSLALLR